MKWRARNSFFFITALMVVLTQPLILFAVSLPSARDIQVDAGFSRTIEIPIENTTESSQTVEFSLMSATFINGQDQPELETLNDEVKTWMSLSRASIELGVGEKDSVALSIDPPSNTPNETVTIAVVATEKLTGQISLNHGSATLVFITVGEEKAIGKCVSFDTSTPSSSPLAGGGPDVSSAKVTMTNAGQGILVADGNIVRRGPFGSRISQSNINPSHHRILSNQTRSWSIDVPPIPWWAVGSFTLGIEDTNIAIDSCGSLSAGGRWWSLIVVGGAIAISAGLMRAFYRRKGAR